MAILLQQVSVWLNRLLSGSDSKIFSSFFLVGKPSYSIFSTITFNCALLTTFTVPTKAVGKLKCYIAITVARQLINFMVVHWGEWNSKYFKFSCKDFTLYSYLDRISVYLLCIYKSYEPFKLQHKICELQQILACQFENFMRLT